MRHLLYLIEFRFQSVELIGIRKKTKQNESAKKKTKQNHIQLKCNETPEQSNRTLEINFHPSTNLRRFSMRHCKIVDLTNCPEELRLSSRPIRQIDFTLSLNFCKFSKICVWAEFCWTFCFVRCDFACWMFFSPFFAYLSVPQFTLLTHSFVLISKHSFELW